MSDTENENTEAPLAPGQKAYGSYFRAMKGTNTKGEALPDWEELLPTLQEAWEAVYHDVRSDVG
jgi:hypothetical protein